MMGAQQGDLEDLHPQRTLPVPVEGRKQKQRVSTTGAVEDSAVEDELLHLRWRPPLLPVRSSLHGVCSLRNPTGQTMPRTSTEPIPCVGSMCEPVAADDVNGGHRAAVPGAVSATHPTSPIKASPFEGRACLPTFTLEGRRTSAPGEASSHLLPHEPLADAQVRLVGDGDAARSETAIGWCLRRIAKRVRGVSHRPTVYGVVVVDSVPTRATATATAGTASATSGTVGGNVGDGILGANARRPDDLASGNRNNGARGHHHPLLG